MTVAKSDLVNFIDFTLFSMTFAQILDYLVSKGKKENLPQARKFLRFVKEKLYIYLFCELTLNNLINKQLYEQNPIVGIVFNLLSVVFL